MSQTHRKRRFVSLAVVAVCPCRLLRAQGQLFCGDEAAGRMALEQEISAHPHRGEPHRILAQFALANGRNADAALELRRWRESADIVAAMQ